MTIRRTFLLILILLFGCATTKTFAPNEISVSPRIGFLKDVTVDLGIFDGRIDKEYSNELVNQITNQLNRTYPSIKFNILRVDEFYKDPISDGITIKISIMTYDAGFGADIKVMTVGTFGGDFGYGVFPDGKWNGVTGFSINIYDNRNPNDAKKFSKNIGKAVSLPNLYGYKTAKKALDDSYKESMQGLLFYIDNSLMK